MTQMAASTAVRKLETGIPGFDMISYGGIPEGRATLVTGRAGTGKTILGLQIVGHFAKQGIRTILVAVEESPSDLLATGDSLGLDLSAAVEQGLLRITDASRPVEGPVMVTGEYDLSGLTSRIGRIAREMDAKAIVVDSASALFSPKPPKALLRALFLQLVHSFRKLDLTAVVLAEAAKDYGRLTTLGIEDFVCDAVVVMRNVVDGERRRRSLEINKYRRSAHFKGEYPCTITARGLTIFPLAAKGNPGQFGGERYSSGFPGLDSMIQGGLFRDSIVIVRGPTGSGKTNLCGTYARAGALRGERVVYYGFEEPKPILMRNFAAIGMDLAEFEAKGNLRVDCHYPESMGLEDLLVRLRLSLEEFSPSLVVLDSISSIEHSSSEKGFRQFMIGLASLLREHGRSALLTQTIMGGQVETHTAPYLSTIADAILALDYSVHDFEMSRTLRVIKMRGSSHVTHPYRLEIGPGGLTVEPQAVRLGGSALPSTAAPASSRALAGLRLLLVEDYEDTRTTIQRLLESEGASVVAAENSEGAFASVAAEQFDVLVCDIGLPGEDGFGLMGRVRALPAPKGETPAVALTAWGLAEDRVRALATGFQAHLVKPVEPGMLISTIRSVVASRDDVERRQADRRG
jgi:circadian clock protein KaiC